MHELFCPKSIIVVGVSESPRNLGKYIVANTINSGFQGKIHPVGPRGGTILGLPIHRSVREVPEAADTAVILTPAQFIPEVLDQCGDKGVRWAVIESGGFRELGPEGAELERKLLDIANRHGIRFVGPNCIGVVDTSCGFCTPFLALPSPFRKGAVSVMAQSGGMGLSLGERLGASGIGVNKIVSMGNKLSLDEADYLSFLIDDPETKIIYFYLEDFKRGRAFAELARGSSKPIVVHKSNTGPLSRFIAQSHTAALAGDDAVVDGVCRECGIVRVHSVEQALKAIRGFSMPPLRGSNLAVISRSGGHAVVAADACARHGFQLPPFDGGLLDKIRDRVRAGVIRLGNPMDLGDLYDLPFYLNVLEGALRQDDIDGAIFIHVSHALVEREASRRLVESLWELGERYGKPVAVVAEVPSEERVFLQNTVNFPFFSEPAEAVEALAIQRDRMKFRPAQGSPESRRAPAQWESGVEAWLKPIMEEKRQPLLHESMDLLDRLGIPTAPWKTAATLPDALARAVEMGYPVAIKAYGPSLLHKSEKGALALNIGDAGQLEKEWNAMHKAIENIQGMVVQKMVFSSREVIVGGKQDPAFGPVVLAGLGGIMVEVLKDVTIRLAPVDADMAGEMFARLAGAPILGPFRGMSRADMGIAAKVLERISGLVHRFPQIREVDVNPLSLDDRGAGALALDARVLLAAS